MVIGYNLRRAKGGIFVRRIIASTVGTSLITSWSTKKGHAEPNLEDLAIFLQEYNNSSSAETNSINKLALKPEYDQLCFLSSDTAGGQLCMKALEIYYAEQGFFNIVTHTIKGLNDNYYDFENRGLKNLLDILSEIYEERRGRELIINATAGNVIRLVPPLTITREDLEHFLLVFKDILKAA